MAEGAQKHDDLLDALWQPARAVGGEQGVEIVDLQLRGSSRRRVLRVDIDRAGPKGVGMEDCSRVSDALGRALEDSDLISSYVLEVSSPGIDRPIQTADDIRRNTGRRLVVHTVEPVDGLRCLRGVLEGADGEALRLAGEGGEEWTIPLGVIERAEQDVVF